VNAFLRYMQDNDRRYALLAGKILGEFGATIAIPAVAAAWLGKRLDAANGTAPHYLMLCLAAAFIVTAVHISRRARAYGKEYDALDTKRVTTAPARKPPSKPPATPPTATA